MNVCFGMRLAVVCAFVVSAPRLQTPTWAQKPVAPANTTRVFHGAWFDVRYPSNFSASPASKSKPSANESDEATFTSPDKRVQFYVFSPQWNGKSAFAVADDKRENLVSKSSENRQDKQFTTKAHWMTVEAKNKSYTRTWEDVETSLNTRHVFGVKYKTETDFKRYRAQYLAFKKSLRQYTD